MAACARLARGRCRGAPARSGLTKHIELPSTSRRPRSSMICTLDTASVRPAWTSVPRAVSVPPARAGRSILSDSSEVAYVVCAGSALWTAQPSGPSARIARVPTEISPWGLSSHRVAASGTSRPRGRPR